MSKLSRHAASKSGELTTEAMVREATSGSQSNQRQVNSCSAVFFVSENACSVEAASKLGQLHRN